MAERGREHERAHLARLRERGLDVEEIAPGDGAPEATAEAMRAGRDVIHQAAFVAGNWRGAADFLLKVRSPSDLGPYSYEPADAKLATHPKPYVIFQLLFYAAMAGQIQGVAPERVHVVLGTDETRSFRPRDFQAYADRVQGRFFRTLQAYRKGAAPPYPYPVEHCAYCDWWARCRDRRRDDDHLSLVAGDHARAGDRARGGRGAARHRARRRAGRRLAARHLGPALAGLRQQAWLQVESRDSDVPLHERLPGARRPRLRAAAAAVRGRRLLRHRGRSILGPRGARVPVRLAHRGRPYQPLWAHDRAQERAAFERWVDWITARLERHPDLHVYHYNHYEPTALKALMSRYGTREAEVDDLLRRKVFVDLYTIVRQALRLGTESYSLKARRGDLPVRARRRGHRGRRLDPRLPGVPRHARRGEARGDRRLQRRRLPLHAGAARLAARPSAATSATSTRRRRARRAPQQLARHAEVERLEAALLADARRPPARRLLADLLQYHRREARPEWWAYFDRLGRTAAELRDDDAEAIGDLVPADDVPLGEVAQSYLHPLRFPPQQHKLSPGIAVDPVTQRGYEIPRIDDDAGLVWLKRRKASLYKPLPTALIPAKPIPQTAQQAALRALAEQATGQISGPSPALRAAAADAAAAARGLARRARRAPRRLGAVHPGPARLGQDLHRGAADLRAAARTGSGSGVAATSHKAIANLLDEVERAAAEAGVDFRGLKKSGGGNPESHYESAHVAASADDGRVPAGRRGDADRGHAVAVGARGAARRRSTCCSSTRPARWRSPTRSRSRAPAAAWCCSATRSSSRTSARAPTRAARAPRCSSTCSATARPCRRPRACSSSAPGACTRTSAASSRTRCTTGRLAPVEGTERQAVASPGLSGCGRPA